MEQPVEKWADDVRGAGGALRFLHLTENLRLADDQRVETGGDPEQMPGGVEIGDLVDVRLQQPADRRRGTR